MKKNKSSFSQDRSHAWLPSQKVWINYWIFFPNIEDESRLNDNLQSVKNSFDNIISSTIFSWSFDIPKFQFFEIQNIKCLFGSTRTFESLEDEEVIVELLIKLSIEYPDAVIRITDEEGEFLPSMFSIRSQVHDPSTIARKAFVKNGEFLLLETKAEISLFEAMKYLREKKPHQTLCRDSSVSSLGNASLSDGNMIKVRCTIPTGVGKYLRDHHAFGLAIYGKNRRISGCHKPGKSNRINLETFTVSCTVSMSRRLSYIITEETEEISEGVSNPADEIIIGNALVKYLKGIAKAGNVTDPNPVGCDSFVDGALKLVYDSNDIQHENDIDEFESRLRKFYSEEFKSTVDAKTALIKLFSMESLEDKELTEAEISEWDSLVDVENWMEKYKNELSDYIREEDNVVGRITDFFEKEVQFSDSDDLNSSGDSSDDEQWSSQNISGSSKTTKKTDLFSEGQSSFEFDNNENVPSHFDDAFQDFLDGKQDQATSSFLDFLAASLSNRSSFSESNISKEGNSKESKSKDMKDFMDEYSSQLETDGIAEDPIATLTNLMDSLSYSDDFVSGSSSVRKERTDMPSSSTSNRTMK